MDEESKELFRKFVSLQKEQNELLKNNLGRIRFGLRALLILMTLSCVGLGYLAYAKKSPTRGAVLPVTFVPPAYQPQPLPADPGRLIKQHLPDGTIRIVRADQLQLNDPSQVQQPPVK